MMIGEWDLLIDICWNFLLLENCLELIWMSIIATLMDVWRVLSWILRLWWWWPIQRSVFMMGNRRAQPDIWIFANSLIFFACMKFSKKCCEKKIVYRNHKICKWNELSHWKSTKLITDIYDHSESFETWKWCYFYPKFDTGQPLIL